MENQEKLITQLTQEANENSPALDEGLLEAVTGAGITDAIKQCFGCGSSGSSDSASLPPIRSDEEYMRTPHGGLADVGLAHRAWKNTFSTPERNSASWRVAAKQVGGRAVGVKYPMAPPPSE